jgi:gluconolactonase
MTPSSLYGPTVGPGSVRGASTPHTALLELAAMATVTTIEPVNLRVLATGLRFPEGPISLADGSVLVVEIERGTLTRVGADGTTEVVAELGGGPNGAAIGPDGKAWITNNGGCFSFHENMGLLLPGNPPPESWPGHGCIQRVDLATGEVEILFTKSNGGDVTLRAPNDLVFDADGGLWFTDHGVRESRSTDRTGVHYIPLDGEPREVIFPLDAPNGIGLSPDGDRVYVAETHTGRLWGWTVSGSGEVSGVNPLGPNGADLLSDPGGNTMFDSLAVDGEGWVCVGTLLQTGITAVSPDGTHVEHMPLGDPLTTNVCFGQDGTTAYATLSGTGQLVAFDWHRPGGRLPFNA